LRDLELQKQRNKAKFSQAYSAFSRHFRSPAAMQVRNCTALEKKARKLPLERQMKHDNFLQKFSNSAHAEFSRLNMMHVRCPSRGVGYFKIIETKSFLRLRELAAEVHGARQWWSSCKGLGSWSGFELSLKLLLRV
jgi:hypothetical protein